MSNRYLRSLTLLLALLAGLSFLSGCNTMRGAGEDMEEAGEALSEEAEEHEDY